MVQSLDHEVDGGHQLLRVRLMLAESGDCVDRLLCPDFERNCQEAEVKGFLQSDTRCFADHLK